MKKQVKTYDQIESYVFLMAIESPYGPLTYKVYPYHICNNSITDLWMKSELTILIKGHILGVDLE